MNRSAPYLFAVATLSLIGFGVMTVVLAALSSFAFSEHARTAEAIGASILGGLLVVFGGVPLIQRTHREYNWNKTRDIATVVAIFLGGLWAAYTFYVQRSDRIAGQVPALEVRIAAGQVTLDPKVRNDLLASVKDKDSVLFIRGCVTIKNVGTVKTSLHLLECIKRDPRDECSRGDPVVGPIVVAKLLPLGSPDRMRFYELTKARFFDEPHRFFLERRAVDLDRGDVEQDDDIRPQAMDKFEFLVTVESGPGVYSIMFTTPIDEAESTRMENTNEYRGREKPLRWDATTFVEVLESPPVVDKTQRVRACD